MFAEIYKHNPVRSFKTKQLFLPTIIYIIAKKTANLAKRSHERLIKEIKKTVNTSKLFKAFFQAEKGQKARFFFGEQV